MTLVPEEQLNIACSSALSISNVISVIKISNSNLNMSNEIAGVFVG